MVPEALWELGADVIAIGVEPDGFNINKDCGSTAPEALGRKVREMRADIGIALDGDADRVIITDERGHVVDGDQLLAVIAESWKDDGRLSQPAVVATVMSNLGLERYLAQIGLKLIRTQVGDRYVLEQMLAQNCNVGGEASGHIILSDFNTTGDGFVAALQVLSVVRKLNRPVSEVCHRFDPLPQVLKNVRYRNGKPLDDPSVKSVIAAAEGKLNGCGRLLVRASGTEPVIRVMGEGDDRDLVEDVVDAIVRRGRRGRGGVSGKDAAFDPAAHRLVAGAALVRGLQARRTLRAAEPDDDGGDLPRLPGGERRQPSGPLRRRILPPARHAAHAGARLSGADPDRGRRRTVSAPGRGLAQGLHRAVEQISRRRCSSATRSIPCSRSTSCRRTARPASSACARPCTTRTA